MDPAQLINKTFNFNIGSIDISPTYWQAAAIVFLLFLLVWSLARWRHLFIKWSFNGWHAWFFMGFLLALILEGFLIVGGRTALTQILGWKNPPKPISTALDIGREKLIAVLGVSDTIPESSAAQTPTYQSVVSDFNKLPADEATQVRLMICQP